ncbi:MAG: hypothetical protein ACR2P0_10875 [Acidimicrobiales bacterium]
MSDTWGGPGWWMATDGLWYPPNDQGELDHAQGHAVERGPAPRTDQPRNGSSSSAANIDGAAGSPKVIDLRQFEVDSPEHVSVGAASGAGFTIRSEASAESFDQVSGDSQPDPTHGSGSERSPSTSGEVGATVGPAHVDSGSSPSASVPEGSDPDRSRVDIRMVEDQDNDAPGSGLVLQHPAAATSPPTRGPGTGTLLLVAATVLAVAAGVLGALWMRERRTVDDLEARLAEAEVADVSVAAQIASLEDQIRTLEVQNAEADREVAELRLLAPEVPVGRITTIGTPLEPVFLQESRGSFIVIDATGDYAIWSGGYEGEITDTGSVVGEPLAVVGIRDQAHISTSEGVVEVISLIGQEDGRTIQSGVVDHVARDEQAFWGFSPDSARLRRYRVGTGRITNTVDLPTAISDLTVGAGAVWALGTDNLVYKVNTADFTLSPLSAGESVISVTAGPDAVWALSAADGSLRRLDAVSGSVLVTVPVGRDPVDAAFSGNSVWVALRSGETLIEVDTRTSAVVSRTKLPAVPIELIPGEGGVFVRLEGDVPLVRVGSIATEVEPGEGTAADAAGE